MCNTTYQGCDGSVLLDNSTTSVSEKDARPNVNTLRGFGVIEDIKEALEKECSHTVSCADILALAARDSVVQVWEILVRLEFSHWGIIHWRNQVLKVRFNLWQTGGPDYEVLLGRRDSTIANYSGANAVLPSPKFNVTSLTQKFIDVGLSKEDMVILSGLY